MRENMNATTNQNYFIGRDKEPETTVTTTMENFRGEENMREYKINDTLILACDHGYGNIKSCHSVFKASAEVSETAPIFSKDYVKFEDKYYVICGINDGYKIEMFCSHLYNIGCKRDRRQFLSNRLNRVIRSNDKLSRMGGDEFVILLCEVESKEQVRKIARRIIESIQKAMIIDNLVLNITISVGFAFYPMDGGDYDSLYQVADERMYSCKQKNKNNVPCFEETN